MVNLVGVTFGRLVVLKRLEHHVTSGGNIIGRWLCKCSCGNEKNVSTSSLKQGKTKSCGCWLIDSAIEKGKLNRVHGGYSKFNSIKDQVKFQALRNIHERSRRRGYESDLEFSDMPELTDFCPVLGIRYCRGTLKDKDGSPSIDRKNPNLPYLKKYRDNLLFISHRANRIKSNATVEEIQKILVYMGPAQTGRESSLIDLKAEIANKAEGLIATVRD